MIALGYTGLGQVTEAQNHFYEVRKMDANHLGAVLHEQLLDGNSA
jgi:hypothetical protein